MPDATETTSGPEVAPVGTVTVTDVSLQVPELAVTGEPFSRTTLLPCDGPKCEPVSTICVPTGPVVDDTVLIMGAGVVVEFTDTLSNATVARLDKSKLQTPTQCICSGPC